MSAAGGLVIGVDVGGTFTDLFVLDEASGSARIVKVPSTPSQPAAAVFEALRRLPAPAEEVDFFV